MKKFKKMASYLYKSYATAFGVILLAGIIMGVIGYNTVVKEKLAIFYETSNSISKDVGSDLVIKDSDKIDSQLLAQMDENAEEYKKKHNIQLSEEIQRDLEDPETNYVDVFSYSRDVEATDELYEYVDYRVLKNKLFDGDKFNIKPALVKFSKYVSISILVMSILVTSFSESLSSYEFEMMFPWKITDNIWLKSGIISILAILQYLIIIAFFVIKQKSGSLGGVLSLEGLAGDILPILIKFVDFSIMFVSLGMIAGNFLGHLGLTIIFGHNLGLIRDISTIIYSLPKNASLGPIAKNYDQLKESVSQFWAPFLDIYFVKTDNILSSWGFLVYALLIAALAYLVNRKNRYDESGIMVKSKPIELIAKIYASLSLASIFYLMLAMDSGIVTSTVRIPVFIGLLCLSYVIFRKMFRKKIKFS